MVFSIFVDKNNDFKPLSMLIIVKNIIIYK